MDGEGAGRGGGLFFSGTFFSVEGVGGCVTRSRAPFRKRGLVASAETPVETFQTQAPSKTYS